jgi:hydroxypyruvate isomerase
MTVRLAANISLMFTEWSFAERFAVARDSGFDAVEFMFPEGLSADEVASLLERNTLKQVLANVPLQAGSKGLAAVVGQERNFRADFVMGLHFASVCGVPLIHATAGIVDPADLTSASDVFRKNVSWAIEAARKEGIAVVVEAINQTAVPNYFIRNLAQAHWWTTQCPGLGYILDLYHAAVEGLDPAQTVDSYLATAGHVQLAGHPGRHEPDEMLLSLIEPGGAISDAPYEGWVGCEYIPAVSTVEGLGWLDRIGRRATR